MTSATLFREGPDLDELLAELDDEHDGRVRVTKLDQFSVERLRRLSMARRVDGEL